MLIGVGVDLLHLARFRSLLARRNPQRLAARICSPWEFEQWNGIQTGAQARESYLATRWAAKEAAYKALYPAFRATWKDLEIRKVDKKPFLVFSPSFVPPSSSCSVPQLRPEDVNMHLSISHDADMLIAYVVAERIA
ncbi:hypothetical protein JCM8097_004186 [Rhodosporidiobolus ruineniae]